MRLRLAYLTVFLIAACGLGYELVAGALSSYLLGDSITQFSVAIGLYLFALGIGAWLSKFIERGLVRRFVDVELAVALAGGTSAAILFVAFAHGKWFRPVLYGEILLVGTLVGLEIPLLMRILKDELDFKELVSQVLTFDYIGALVVSLVFPLLLVPRLGLVQSAFLFGLVNALVGLWSTWIFAPRLGHSGGLRARALLACAVLTGGLVLGQRVVDAAELSVYGDPILVARSTPYQRIVVTSNAAGHQLFLNGALQYSSADEYRYHEALVHPAFASVAEPRRVLILGGGDGLALREVLRRPEVERATLVDIDPAMVELARTFPPLVELNARAFEDPRVTVVHDDAMRWLDARRGPFDVVVVDFPDPANFALGKLYTTAFYVRVAGALAPGGVLAVQSTSPLASRSAYWCVVRTVEASGFVVRPYHALVPSFGEWGFLLARREEFPVPAVDVPGARFLDAETMRALFVLGPDLAPVDVQPNRLDDQRLVRYYEDEWRRWN
ncbi:MAG: polyamine aminopropyltransferase [Planctomycetes bacterium]|nr:polyamine aminopropyltransferase [Planctomycetota bacterium]